MITCPSCGKDNPEGFAFCGFCSASLEIQPVDGLVLRLACDLGTEAAEGLTVEGVVFRLKLRAALMGIDIISDSWAQQVGEELVAMAASPEAQDEAVEFCSQVVEVAEALAR